jgi:hypothetical protein
MAKTKNVPGFFHYFFSFNVSEIMETSGFVIFVFCFQMIYTKFSKGVPDRVSVSASIFTLKRLKGSVDAHSTATLCPSTKAASSRPASFSTPIY